MDRLRSLLGTLSFPSGFMLCLMFCTAPPVQAKHQSLSFDQDLNKVLVKANEFNEAQEYDLALAQFQQAQRLIHLQDGVLSPRQNPLLEQMAIIHLAQGSFQQANRMMELQHRIVGQASDYSPEAMAPSFQTLGRWYQKTLQPKKSQHAYQSALDVTLANALPRGELAEIRLNMLVNEYLMVDCCEIEDALPGFDGLSLSSEQWLELGDLSLLAGEHEHAKEFYARSGATLSATPIGVRRIDHLAREYVAATLERRSRMSIVTSAEMTPARLIGAPLLVCESRLSDVSGRHDYSSFKFSLSFAVNSKGKVKKLKIRDSNAPSAVESLFRRQLEATVYRPDLVAGKVRSSDVSMQQSFDRAAGPGPAEHRAATQLGCVAAARALEQDIYVADVY